MSTDDYALRSFAARVFRAPRQLTPPEPQKAPQDAGTTPDPMREFTRRLFAQDGDE